MDQLISTLQQKLQESSKSSLLQNQQNSQEKINELLEKSTQALLCGPDCQKEKTTDELRQKYLDAQTNLQNAPAILEQTKKKYYVYSKGTPYYDNMIEKELQQKTTTISKMVGDNFKDELTAATTMNNYYNTALVNSNYTKELLDSYMNENQELKLSLRNRYGDILTNDRKTYYENNALSELQMWYKFWWYIYYILVVVLLVAFVLSPNNLTTGKKIIIGLLALLYPYFIDYIVKWISNFLSSAYHNLPKNVYNDL